LAPNLAFRRSLIEQGDADPVVAEQLRLACEHDFLFFCNAFGWIYEARDDDKSEIQNRELPFITWPFQDEFFRTMLPRLGCKHTLIEKSRDVGASWGCLYLIFHRWLFRHMDSWLLISRNETYVDSARNPKSLFWKLDFILHHLPAWLIPRHYDRTFMQYYNGDNGSVIDGETTTENIARGDRRTGILFDEFGAFEQGFAVLAASRQATNCRIFNSTHRGTHTAFYDERERLKRRHPDAVIRLHWSQHPIKGAGLYRTDGNGDLLLLDKTYRHPEDYLFVLDHKLRSPWYDIECQEQHPRDVAQELDIDPLGAACQFFERSDLQPLIDDYARPPQHQGNIQYSSDPIRFESWHEEPNGLFRVWTTLNFKDGRPPQDRDYVMGIDIATGSASASGSNSVISVGDCKTSEKVLEYADPRIRPEKFAEVAVAVANWFGGVNGGAFMIWEGNGIGTNFGDRVIELGYRRVYMRRNEFSLSKKQTLMPGWWSTPDTKRAVLGEYRRALLAREFINHSDVAVEECLQYIYTVNGSVEHSLAVDTVDPSGAKANHGDRVLADALCLKGMGPAAQRVQDPEPLVIPPNCMAGRDKESEREEAKANQW